jgi:hypothetical protein
MNIVATLGRQEVWQLKCLIEVAESSGDESSVEPNLPANPLSIELTLSYRRSWWQAGGGEPERWSVSADLWDLDLCADDERHVADLDLTVVNYARESEPRDSAVLDEWVPSFVQAAMADSESGRLHPELEARISAGPARMAVLGWIEVAEPWSGHGFAAALAASTLRMLGPAARLGVCRVTPAEVADRREMDEVSAELASARLGEMLNRAGFFCWRGTHVVDLRSPGLLEAGAELLRRWWPAGSEAE